MVWAFQRMEAGMEQAKVVILFGGRSEEHSVSLLSAESILSHIDRDKYKVYPVGMTKDGIPYYFTGEIHRIGTGDWEAQKEQLHSVTFERGSVRIGTKESFLPKAIFPMLHGAYGEDGRLQGFLDSLSLPYVGCGCLCSALAMHKHHAKLQLRHWGIPTTKWLCIHKRELEDKATLQKRIYDYFGNIPLFVKPAAGGSSIGAAAVESPDLLFPALCNAMSYGDEALVEERIWGKECEVGVLWDKEAVVSPPASIFTSHDFYDFEAKYKAADTALSLDADIPADAKAKMQLYAKQAFLALGCRHLARFDFFYTKEGQVILNEVNTMPGMTRHSLFPKMMEQMGISFSTLITRLIVVAS